MTFLAVPSEKRDRRLALLIEVAKGLRNKDSVVVVRATVVGEAQHVSHRDGVVPFFALTVKPVAFTSFGNGQALPGEGGPKEEREEDESVLHFLCRKMFFSADDLMSNFPNAPALSGGMESLAAALSRLDGVSVDSELRSLYLERIRESGGDVLSSVVDYCKSREGTGRDVLLVLGKGTNPAYKDRVCGRHSVSVDGGEHQRDAMGLDFRAVNMSVAYWTFVRDVAAHLQPAYEASGKTLFIKGGKDTQAGGVFRRMQRSLAPFLADKVGSDAARKILGFLELEAYLLSLHVAIQGVPSLVGMREHLFASMDDVKKVLAYPKMVGWVDANLQKMKGILPASRRVHRLVGDRPSYGAVTPWCRLNTAVVARRRTLMRLSKHLRTRLSGSLRPKVCLTSKAVFSSLVGDVLLVTPDAFRLSRFASDSRGLSFGRGESPCDALHVWRATTERMRPSVPSSERMSSGGRRYTFATLRRCVRSPLTPCPLTQEAKVAPQGKRRRRRRCKDPPAERAPSSKRESGSSAINKQDDYDELKNDHFHFGVGSGADVGFCDAPLLFEKISFHI